jgi:hypothetical protein
LAEAKSFSHGEYLLIQCALDFWNGEGGLKVGAALEVWDDENIIAFVRGLLRLRELDWSEIFEGENPC